MRNRLLSSLLGLGSLVALTGAPAFGMVVGEINAKIPFEFRIGSATLPAGKYLILSADSFAPNILEIRNANGSPAVLVQTTPLSPRNGIQSKSELVFQRVGNQEYLTQVWESGSDTGNRVAEPALPVPGEQHSESHPVPAHGASAH